MVRFQCRVSLSSLRHPFYSPFSECFFFLLIANLYFGFSFPINPLFTSFGHISLLVDREQVECDHVSMPVTRLDVSLNVHSKFIDDKSTERVHQICSSV